MMIRTALFACAAFAAAAAPALAQQAPARCQETSFRVYFQHGSATLDAVAEDVLEAAARNVEGCDYREIRVALDGPLASQRGRAIAAALDESWFDATHFTQRAMMQRVSYGPDYAEVTLSPTPSQPQADDRDSEAGV